MSSLQKVLERNTPRTWLVERRHEVELSLRDEEGFHVLIGRSEDWSPRVYVRLITDLFEKITLWDLKVEEATVTERSRPVL